VDLIPSPGRLYLNELVFSKADDDNSVKSTFRKVFVPRLSSWIARITDGENRSGRF
jgi:hypothetical protein